VVVSTAADTARRTARELDLKEGYTVEAFCRAVEQGRLRPDERTVVIVEEACMVDTVRMHRLLQAAGPAIIRTLGDPEQAQAVGAAGWHAQVDQALGGHAELTTVVRQRDPADREVCRLIRQGHAPEALVNLNARGRVHLCTNPSVAVKEVVHAWDRHRHHRGLDGVKIVTDTSNATIDTLNSLCQARRRRAGELSWPSVELVDREAGRREQVYVGDRVCFIRPYRAENGERIANGTGGTVVHMDLGLRRVTVACEDGRQVPVALMGRKWAQPLRLGYAGHALRLQGGQAQVVLVLPGSWQTSRQSAYSMARMHSTSRWRRWRSAGHAMRASTRRHRRFLTWNATRSTPPCGTRCIGPVEHRIADGSGSSLRGPMTVRTSRTTVRTCRCTHRRRLRACVHWPTSWRHWGPPRGHRSRLTSASLMMAWDWS
jgi:hypothetical protein